MSALDMATLGVSVISALVAVAAYITARRDPRPRIQGTVNTVLHAPLALPGGRQITAIMLHATVTNARQYPVHLVSYDLEVDRGHGLERLKRLRRVQSFPRTITGRA